MYYIIEYIIRHRASQARSGVSWGRSFLPSLVFSGSAPAVIGADPPHYPRLLAMARSCFLTLLLHIVFHIDLGASWEPLGAILASILKGFWSQRRCQHRRWPKWQNCISPRRGSKNEGFETPKKPPKIDAAASSKQVSSKMQANFVTK